MNDLKRWLQDDSISRYLNQRVLVKRKLVFGPIIAWISVAVGPSSLGLFLLLLSLAVVFIPEPKEWTND